MPKDKAWSFVIPAKAGIQGFWFVNLNSRFRRNAGICKRRWPVAQSTRTGSSLLPFSNEHVRLSRLASVAIRREYEAFPVRREHGEPVEGIVERNSFQPGSIHVHDVEIEVASLGIADV